VFHVGVVAVQCDSYNCKRTVKILSKLFLRRRNSYNSKRTVEMLFVALFDSATKNTRER